MEKTMRDTVLFDMDGVLVDSQPLHFQVDLGVLRRAGIANPPQALVGGDAGTLTRERWQKLKARLNLPQSVAELCAWHAEIFRDTFGHADLRPVAGVPDLLMLLRANGVKTAVASSSSIALINLILDKLRIKEFFQVLVTGETMPRGKPAPDVFLRAAAELRRSPADCVVVEDSTQGVQAAKNAGMKCVGYRNPTSGEQDLSSANLIIDHFAEISRDLCWLRES
jgi:HAD superfamily hydrolase (TIGR01509 family)